METLDLAQIDLLNTILTYTKILTFNDFTNEFTLKKVLIELDSQYESIAGELEFMKGDKLGVKYSNITSLIDSLYIYFNSNGIKEKLTYDFNIKDSLKEEKIVNKSTSQLELLSEALLLIAYFGHINNKYTSTISYDQVDSILYFIQKYLIDPDSIIDENALLSRKRSTMFNERNALKREKEKLIELTINQDEEIRRLNNSIKEISNDLKEAKSKIKEYEYKRDINIQQSVEEVKELWLQTKMENSVLVKEVDELKLEKANLTNIIKFNEEVSENEKRKLRNNIDLLEDKLVEFKAIQQQNSKLVNKIKDFEMLKERQEKMFSIQAESEKMSNLIKEKGKLIETINELRNEIKKEKEKNKIIENEKKTMNINVSQMNFLKEIRQIEENEQEDSFVFDLNNKNDNLLKLIDNHNTQNFYLSQEDKVEYIKTNKQQIEEIHRLTEENANILREKDKLEANYEFLQSEVDKMSIINEKQELQISKLELERQKVEIEIEKSKILESSSLQSVIENNKIEINQLYDKVSKLKETNKTLVEDNSRLQKEIQLKGFLNKKANEKVSPSKKEREKEKENKEGNDDISNILIAKDKEIENLKKDILKLKNSMIASEKQIHKNEEKIKDFQIKIKEMISKEEYDILKKKYDELNKSINQEHELIANNLHDLSNLFLGMKDEFQKRLENKPVINK